MSSDEMGMRGSGGGGGGHSSYNDSNWDSNKKDDRNWYSEQRSRDSYEDDYHYDGEREDSENETVEPPSSAKRYRDKERASPTSHNISSTISEKKVSGNSAINISVNSKVQTKQPVAKSNKKIDMGAASTFGKNDLGINSPTHRNTHAEEDLFATDNNTTLSSVTNNKSNNNHLSGGTFFETCKTPSPTNIKLDNQNDFEFNPREDEHEFGDFESAFGGESIGNIVAPKSVQSTTTKDAFADFGSAFITSPSSSNANSLSNSLLFDSVPPPSASLPLFGASSNQLNNLMGAPQQPAAPTHDLLSDFGGLNMNTSVFNANNTTLEMVVTSTNHTTLQPIKNDKKQQDFHNLFQTQLEELQSIGKILSQKDLEQMLKITKEMLYNLPGPVTPECLRRQDQSIYMDWRLLARNQYSVLCDTLIELIDRNWSDHGDNNLFLIDANSEFIISAFSALTSNKCSGKMSQISEILMEMITSETILFASFVDLSFIQTPSIQETNHLEQQSQDYIQLLVSMPNKIANQMQRKTNEIFSPEIYSNILLINVLKAIYFVIQTNAAEPEPIYETKFLSKLLSRIIIDFNFNKSSVAISDCTSVLIAWSAADNFRRSIQKIIQNLNRSSIEIFIHFLFEHKHSKISNTLGMAVQNSNDWNYCLLTKVPLLSIFNGDTVPLNLIQYLLDVSIENPDNIIDNLLLELLDVWSNKTCMQRTSFEQHLYVTKLMILLAAAGKLFTAHRGTDIINDLKQKLLKGVAIHIECQGSSLRCVGMITAEILLDMFETNKTIEPLKFDYAGYSAEDIAYTETLKKLPELLYTFQMFVNHQDPDSVINDMYNRHSKEILPIKNKELRVVPIVVNKQKEQPDDDDESLDSDDDLEPYDMSNDVPETMKKAPLYLLDLKETLGERQDPDVFIKSLESCEQLLLQQLPDNDVKLGIDILNILITLEQHFAMDTFEMYRLAGCVAACTIYPKECAEWLCIQFHRKTGTYSIATKILILEVLSESAKRLSQISESSVQQQITTEIIQAPNKLVSLNETDNRKLAEKIIRSRVEQKTRRFATKTQHPFKNARINKFSDVAGSFFFPLLFGFGEKQLTLRANQSLEFDVDNVLLINFLNTLSTVTLAAQNCPIVRKFAKEIVQLSLVLRYNTEPKIRLAILQLIATALIAVPKKCLVDDLFNDICEIRVWLEMCCQPNVVVRGETNEECRNLARNVLYLCIDILSV